MQIEKINQGIAIVALLDQCDVAHLLKVSTRTLEYWRWKGLGPKFVKVGKLARYLESDILEFVRNLQKGGDE